MGSEARNHIARGLPVAQRCRQPAVSTENCALDHTTQCEIAPRYGNGRGKEDSRMKIGILKKPLAATALLLALSTTADAQDVIVCESLAGLNDTMTYMAFTNEICDAGLKVSDFNYKLYRLATARKTKVSDSLSGEAVRCALEGSQALAETWRTGCEAVSEPPRGKGPKKK
jgi:hypothetical protein